MAVTYASYLRLDELLALQRPHEGELEHDETLFIIIHQVYELWFKEVLHELDHLTRLLRDNATPQALHTLKRILTVLKVLVAQIDILETMNPLGFLSFRDRLESGSGFQSFQFRELEFVLGLKQASAVERYPDGSRHRERVERRYNEPGLWDAFLVFLQHHGYTVPRALLERDLTRPIEPSPELQRVLVQVYRTDPGVMAVCEPLVDPDEPFMAWRHCHVERVERTLRTPQCTGGSAGADYLLT